jgi:hypothetical protein
MNHALIEDWKKKNKLKKNYNYKRKDNKEKVQQEDERNVIL